METLTALRDLPELLGTIDQADRAALYQTLRLRITYRRVGDAEELKLKASFRAWTWSVSEGGLEGLLPSPWGVHYRSRAEATSGVTCTISPLTGGAVGRPPKINQLLLLTTVRSRRPRAASSQVRG